MAGFSTTADEHLIRSNLWSAQLKETLEDELFASKYVDMITDFPDGTTFNIPSIGQQTVYNYAENDAIQYSSMDTGNFTFSITDYKASATYITEKMKQDSFYMSRLTSSFVPKQARAIAKSMEVDLLSKFNSGQTASNPNLINGGDHRFVGNGTNEVMSIKDFAIAKYSLEKANVPLDNLIAIVDPSVEYELQTLTNLVNVSNNPKWEGIIRDGISTGMHFSMNIYGFDVWVSQNLPTSVNESITGNNSGGAKTSAAGVANYFFSASADVLPMVGAIRQPPRVDSEFNKDYQREEFVTTSRWGYKLFRPENLVTVITDTDQVS
jgi:hypothetical protein